MKTFAPGGLVRRAPCFAVLACALAGGSGPAGAAVKMLSGREDFGGKALDAGMAIKSHNEASAFWGAGTLLAQPPGPAGADAARALARRKDSFYDAAFLLAVHQNDGAILSLASSAKPEDTSLAAAAAALWALGDQLAAEKAKTVRVELEDEEGAARGGGGRKQGAGKGRRAGGAYGAGAKPPPSVGALLASKDPTTAYHAILAAAYARDGSVAGTVAAVKDTSPRTLAAKLLYKAMTAGAADAQEILALAQKVSSAVVPTRSAAASPDAIAPGFRLDVPPMTLICEAIGEWKHEASLPVLAKALAMPEIPVQVEAARALRRIGSPKAVPLLIQALPHAPWPTLVELCAAAGELPDARTIPALIARLAKENGRMRLDLVHALSCIAGDQKAEEAADWAKWWEKNKAAFQVDPAASAAFREKTRVQDVNVKCWGMFYTLGVFSDRFCYVVDTSDSMKGARIASLRENLADSVQSLPEHVRFDIVDFGGDVEALDANGLTTSKRAAKERAAEMDLSHGTRSFCAMRQGMLIPGVDTIYFLSDGAPHDDSVQGWPKSIRGVLLLTRHCPVAVFCIDFDPKAGNKAAMSRLAAEHCGLQESIEVGPPAPDPPDGGQQ